jgi:hypothetical protein
MVALYANNALTDRTICIRRDHGLMANPHLLLLNFNKLASNR